MIDLQVMMEFPDLIRRLSGRNLHFAIMDEQNKCESFEGGHNPLTSSKTYGLLFEFRFQICY